MVEVAHDAFELAFTHLAVGKLDLCTWNQFGHLRAVFRSSPPRCATGRPWPPRLISRWQARGSASFHWLTKVLIGWRASGGVAMIDRSRMPDIAMFSVRGIGVAVRVRMSTSARSAFRRSLCRTPKRCLRR